MHGVCALPWGCPRSRGPEAVHSVSNPLHHALMLEDGETVGVYDYCFGGIRAPLASDIYWNTAHFIVPGISCSREAHYRAAATVGC